MKYPYMTKKINMNLQENIHRIQSMMGVINESPFFNRRVDLDKVKEILVLHSDQVYHETESYDQFKYELTLKAVEAAIWQDFGLGWEDLPSEEEIKYVTEVSEMFEDLIKHLYKSHLK